MDSLLNYLAKLVWKCSLFQWIEQILCRCNHAEFHTKFSQSNPVLLLSILWNHRMAWLESISKTIQFQHRQFHRQSGQPLNQAHQLKLPRLHPTWPWTSPGLGHAHAHLANPCQHLIALSVKNFPNILFRSFPVCLKTSIRSKNSHFKHLPVQISSWLIKSVFTEQFKLSDRRLAFFFLFWSPKTLVALQRWLVDINLWTC